MVSSCEEYGVLPCLVAMEQRAYSNTDVGGRFDMLGGSVAIFVVEIFDFTF